MKKKLQFDEFSVKLMFGNNNADDDKILPSPVQIRIQILKNKYFFPFFYGLTLDTFHCLFDYLNTYSSHIKIHTL